MLKQVQQDGSFYCHPALDAGSPYENSRTISGDTASSAVRRYLKEQFLIVNSFVSSPLPP